MPPSRTMLQGAVQASSRYLILTEMARLISLWQTGPAIPCRRCGIRVRLGQSPSRRELIMPREAVPILWPCAMSMEMVNLTSQYQTTTAIPYPYCGTRVQLAAYRFLRKWIFPRVTLLSGQRWAISKELASPTSLLLIVGETQYRFCGIQSQYRFSHWFLKTSPPLQAMDKCL